MKLTTVRYLTVVVHTYKTYIIYIQHRYDTINQKFLCNNII